MVCLSPSELVRKNLTDLSARRHFLRVCGILFALSWGFIFYLISHLLMIRGCAGELVLEFVYRATTLFEMLPHHVPCYVSLSVMNIHSCFIASMDMPSVFCSVRIELIRCITTRLLFDLFTVVCSTCSTHYVCNPCTSPVSTSPCCPCCLSSISL